MKILYAEDELQLSMAVTEILKMEEYEVDAVYDGEEALEHVLNQEYDAIILDIMMPKKSGIEVVTAMRDKGIFTPVMLLTAKNETDDRIAGLSSGADDYLGKPFAMGELIARLNAMLRRTTQYKTKTIASGNISLNCETGELKSDQGSLRLSNKETALLSMFMKKEATPFSSKELMEQLWKEQEDEDAVLLYVSYLRNKLKQIHAEQTIIQDGEFFTFE